MKRIGFLKDKNYNLLKKKCMSSIVQYIFKSWLLVQNLSTKVTSDHTGYTDQEINIV